MESKSYGWRLYKVDVAGSIAHVAMLAKVGLITDSDRDAIAAGLKQIEAEIDRDGSKWATFQAGAGRYSYVLGIGTDRTHR